ncbi:MAG: hypothetical protein OS112_03220 [Methanoregula sp.]|nr:MAG: hypothetical protein OS112_03220 [Methanoregula sp.]
MVKRDVIVSEDVYWALVNRKFAGQYRSIDEVLRPVLGMQPGKRPRLKKYLQEQEYMKEKQSDGDIGEGKCPAPGFRLATRTRRGAIILSLFRFIGFLSEAIFQRGGIMPAPVICPHCHTENVRRRESVGKDDHGKVLYKYPKVKQCRQCGVQIARDLPGREIPPDYVDGCRQAHLEVS